MRAINYAKDENLLVIKSFKGSFSNLVKAKNDKGESFYCKFFDYSKPYKINGYDLSPVFSRDRLFVSLFFQSIFEKNSNLNKYFVKIKDYSAKKSFLVSDEAKGISLEKLILEKKINTALLNKIVALSFDFLKINKRIKNPGKKIKSEDVLKLKLDLQFARPLRHILSKKRVGDLVKNIGNFSYACHGDLQPKNIVVSSKGLKIIDFEEGFVGPRGWDVGFLWGNMIYLSSLDSGILLAYKKLIVLLKESKLKDSLILFTMSAMLMRVFMFPVIKLNVKKRKELINLANSFLILNKV